jgi:hypothetical protein
MLSELPSGALVGMDRVGLVSIALTLTLPFLLRAVETHVRRRDAVPVPSLAPELQ